MPQLVAHDADGYLVFIGSCGCMAFSHHAVVTEIHAIVGANGETALMGPDPRCETRCSAVRVFVTCDDQEYGQFFGRDIGVAVGIETAKVDIRVSPCKRVSYQCIASTIAKITAEIRI